MTSPSAEPFRVAVIGTGFMGKAHAMALTSAEMVFPLPRPAQLHTVCDTDATAAAAAAQRFGFRATATDWRVVIADPAIDLVTITTPTFWHYDIARAAIEAGKHVLCEKPLTVEAEPARDLVELAQRHGVVAMVGYNYLGNPAVIEARRLIDNGAVGTIHSVRLVNDEDYMADPGVGHSWRCRRDLSGTGTLGDLGAHALSLALYLVGPVARVTAMTRTIIRERQTADGTPATVENEDCAEVLLRFANGAAGTLASSRIAWGRKNALGFEITGSAGTLVFDQERFNELRFYRAGEKGFTCLQMGPEHVPYGAFLPAPGHQLGFNDLKTIEMIRLLRAACGEIAPFPDFDFGARIEAIQAAIEQANAAEAWITLPQDSQGRLAEPPSGEWHDLPFRPAHG